MSLFSGTKVEMAQDGEFVRHIHVTVFRNKNGNGLLFDSECPPAAGSKTRPRRAFGKRPALLAIKLSSTGFANSRIRAPSHVQPRSPGSRHSLCRGLNEEFYIKKSSRQKSYGAWKVKKITLHSLNLVRTARFMRGCAHLVLQHESRGGCLT